MLSFWFIQLVIPIGHVFFIMSMLSPSAMQAREHVNHKPNETKRQNTNGLGHRSHDYGGEAVLDPGMGLPLNNVGMDTVSFVDAIMELLCCLAIITKD